MFSGFISLWIMLLVLQIGISSGLVQSLHSSDPLDRRSLFNSSDHSQQAEDQKADFCRCVQELKHDHFK